MKKHKTAWESEGFKLLEAGWYGLEGIVHRDSDYIRALEAALERSLSFVRAAWAINEEQVMRDVYNEVRASVGWNVKP